MKTAAQIRSEGQLMRWGIIATGLFVLCRIFPAQGETVSSVQSGEWADSGIWGGGAVPVSGDVVYVRAHSVTSSAPSGTLTALAVLGGSGPGQLTMNSGSSIGVSGNLTLNYGGLTVNSGSALTHQSSSGYIQLAAAAGAANRSSSMTLAGGTVTSDRVALFGGSAATAATGTLTVASGSLTFAGQRIQCDPGAGSAVQMFVDGGALTCSYIQFKDSAAGSQMQSLTVNGGDLHLTAANYTASLQFADANSRVWFEDGSMIWEGVDSVLDFDALQSVFDAWVDAGFIDSANFSSQQLKKGLIFDGANAVLDSGLMSFGGELVVASSGNDGAEGSLAEPLATLIGARDRIRLLRSAGYAGAVTVFVRGGTYYESETLVLEEQDSGTENAPVVYKAYPGETPVISGGRNLGAAAQNPDGSCSVYIPEADDWQWKFHQLFVDDVRYNPARSPNEGYFYVQGIPPEPADTNYYGAPYWYCHNFEFSPGDLENWSTLASNDVSICVYTLWDTVSVWLTSVDETSNTAFTATHVLGGLDPLGGNAIDEMKRYVVVNAPGSLDAPGEWQLDRDSGMLTVLPFGSENMATQTWVVPLAQTAISIEGSADATQFVDHVRFEGLAFRHYAAPELAGGKTGGWRYGQAASRAPACVQIDAGRNIEFLSCDVSQVGTHAIHLGRGCTSNRIEQCHLYDLGGGGILCGEPTQTQNGYDSGLHGFNGYNVLYNNYIHDGGILHPGSCGILIAQSADNLVSHNDIGFFNWSGMQIGWNWDTSSSWSKNNRVECNRIHDIGQNVLSDMGAIYTVGENLDTLIRSNVICSVFCWVEGSGGKGFYPDQQTDGVTFSENLVYNLTSFGLGVNSCRSIVLRNNVFAMNYHKAPCHLGSGADAVIENNIFYYYWGSVYGDKFNKINADWFVACDSNLFWRIGGGPVTFQQPSPDGSAVTNLLTLAEWQSQTGLDMHSVVADPMFADPENGDFSLTDPANAQAVGFNQVDWSLAGLTGDAVWTTLPDLYGRDASYAVYKAPFLRDLTRRFPLKTSDTILSAEFSLQENGGEPAGAMRLRRINVPVDTTNCEVKVTSDLLSGEWTVLTNLFFADDVGAREVMMAPDIAPIESFDSRFYTIRTNELPASNL